MIKADEERAKDENWKNVDVHIVDSQDTKLPDAKFTYTITSFAFELFLNSDVALNEIHRSLVPRGVFDIPLVVGDWLGEGNKRSGYSWNSAEAIEKLLADRGYTDIKMTLKRAKTPMTIEQFTEGSGGKTMVTLLMGGYSDAERKEWEGKILPALADHWDEVSDKDGG
ncbi:hypothetical protein BKA62DRAFT_805660 [Auriculariales sp. MPI-PUGE-AT-0066]|nr:hypothetical protein BKA62DRAFT_805660 [Auriculariales sp. MPI-PUGE-AT-0066]